MTKTLYIMAGCNGAGKTTASMLLLPAILDCTEFVNADEIAKGLSPFHPEEVAVQAGKLMVDRINLLVEGDKSFAVETTLSTKSYRSLIETAHKKGFKVLLFFFRLPDAHRAIERVAQRVSEGGHNIPKDVIIRRFSAGLDNFSNIYKGIVDSWILIDNYSIPRVVLADGGLTDDERSRLIDGLEWAQHETLKRKAMRAEMVLQDNEDGEVVRVSARDVFEKLYSEPAPTF
ncbi:MAG: zeta toxin family protein [Bacteroidaceae bacterium]|nr:zeta toxin family protein [Bacteroidaceae bacterium]